MKTLMQRGDDYSATFTSGYLDEVRIYNQALSQTEIQAIMDECQLEEPSGDRLVGYWKFDGDATDSSGNGNDGTEYGSPSYIDNGGCGNALNFDGTPNTYVRIPDSDSLDVTGDFTIGLWV